MSFFEFVKTSLKSSKGLWTIADQALLSMSNFTLMFLAARFLSPFDFGVFSLLYSLLLLGLNVQGGVLLDPLVVLLPGYSGTDVKTYVSSAFIQQVLLSVILGAFVFLCFGFQDVFAVEGESFDLMTALSLGYALVSYQKHEFFRRLLFQAVRLKAVFFTDFMGHALRFSFLFLALSEDSLTISKLLFLIGHGFLLSALLQGAVSFREFAWGLTFKWWAWAANWQQGRWLLSTNLIVWGVAHAYLFILADVLGAEEAGALRAIQTLFGPLTMLLLAIENLGSVLAARRFNTQGAKSLESFMANFVLLLVVAGGSYCLLMILFGETLLDVFYRGQYKGVFVAIAFLGAAQTVGLVGRGASIGLRVLLVPDRVFRAYLLSGGVMLLSAYPLVKSFQLSGATAGTLLSTVTTVWVVALFYRKAIKSKTLGNEA